MKNNVMRSIFSFFLITMAYLLTGCTYDYNVGSMEYKAEVVLNSIINPDSTIKVNLFWTKEAGSSQEDYNRVAEFNAKIYENDNLIFEGVNLKDSIKTTYYPKEGAKYRLEVEVPEYGILSAETSIPQAPTAEVKYSGQTDGLWGAYSNFEVNNILPNSEMRSIMVQVLGFYDNGQERASKYLYANNPFCDQFNAYYDGTMGPDTYYENYIRIPFKNLELAAPLSLYIEVFSRIYVDGSIIGYDDWGFPIYDDTTYEPIYTVVEVIAPSDDYDKYYKSAHQQSIFDGGGPFSIVIPIHSNIENGLGIFAGYSCESFKIEEEKEDEE